MSYFFHATADDGQTATIGPFPDLAALLAAMTDYRRRGFFVRPYPVMAG